MFNQPDNKCWVCGFVLKNNSLASICNHCAQIPVLKPDKSGCCDAVKDQYIGLKRGKAGIYKPTK